MDTTRDNVASSRTDPPAPSLQDQEGLFLTLKEWVQADMEHSQKWRTRAKSNYSFVTPFGQWSPEDAQRLKDEMRPAVTFDKTLKFVRAVCGIEANNRHETVFLPRHVAVEGEVKKNELLSGTSQWMDDTSNAPRHQSRAFRDAIITGMGWTESHIDQDDDPRGLYRENRVNPLEMGWDRDARDQNLLDAKRVWRVRKMQISEARALLPGVTDQPGVLDADLDAFWASGVDAPKTGTPKTQEQKELRAENMVAYDPKREVYIVQVQWWEYKPYYKTVDPMRRQLIDVDEAQFQQMSAQMGGQLPAAKLRRKVFKQAFLGSVLLSVGPCPRKNGFTFQPITYEPDDNEGTWYGLVDVLRDPQIWVNKFFAQIMHIINSTAKGGILLEEDAVTDVQQFTANYAKPNAVSILSKGAIAKGKVMAKPGAGLTAGVMQLLAFSDDAFGDTSGLNLELMGLADRDQAGVLEAQRKQAAMTILATLFDSLALFRQEKARCRLEFIQDVLAADTPRMIRIAGPDGYKAIPLLKSGVVGEYDTVVEDAPSSPNTKERVWASLMTVMPAFKDMITPEVAITILEYAPGLPAKLVDSLKAIASKPNPDAEEQKMLAITSAVEDIKKTKSETQKNLAAAEASGAKAALDIAMVGVEQANANVARFMPIFDMVNKERDRRHQMAMASAEGAMEPTDGAPRPPPQLPELGAQETGEPAPQPMPMSPTMPGGLMPQGM
jgi:hypothetical protein